MNKKALIIGSGIGGIATSIRLALKGYDVTIFEKDSGPGGKLNVLQLGNYRFDLGPSLFTMPHFVTELFELAGKDPADYFTYKKVDLACRYFWEDGLVMNDWSDPEKLAEESFQKLGAEKQRVTNYIRHAIKLYDKTAPVFLQKSLHQWKNYLSADWLKAGTYFPNMDIFKTMDKANRQRLGHPRLVQMFNRMATYNGSSPYKAPGILAIITSLEHGPGVFFPEKGMYSITRSLVRLAEELGVTFRYSEEVTSILHSNKKVKGIKTNKGEYEAETVVSNMDVVHTFRKLMKDIPEPTRTLNQERSSSALVFYWGMKNSYPELDLHNIFFSDNYPKEFQYIFDKLEMYDDPTVYVHISSKESPADAPDGHENWFVMVNAPHNEGQDWQGIAKVTRKNIIDKLSRILGKNVEEDIAIEYVFDPPAIESKTSSWRGSLYGTSSNSKFAAFLRHPNFTRKMKGLYFVGGSVHPGGGIPLCLQGAKILGEVIC